jgi:long-chain acyl-CoA synthetase
MDTVLGTRPDERRRPPALDAATMCEAFQVTAAAYPDHVALRTIGDGVAITFTQYRDRVRTLAGGLHSLGVRRGDTLAFMVTNRPEFHLLDTAAMHLGATPFSIYNTSSVEQIAYLLGDAGCRVAIIEAAFLEQMQEAIAATGTVEHLRARSLWRSSNGRGRGRSSTSRPPGGRSRPTTC